MDLSRHDHVRLMFGALRFRQGSLCMSQPNVVRTLWSRTTRLLTRVGTTMAPPHAYYSIDETHIEHPKAHIELIQTALFNLVDVTSLFPPYFTSASLQLPPTVKFLSNRSQPFNPHHNMVNINLSYTSRINPSGASPVLNQAQIWAGLQRKIRFAQEFVPVIESCKVLEESEGGTVTREVVFKKGMGPKDRAKEVCRGFWPSWVSLTCLLLRISI
jgi:hypothetical protein